MFYFATSQYNIVKNIIYYIYLEHFALFASFAVHDFFHRKERKVRKDSLKGVVLKYIPLFGKYEGGNNESKRKFSVSRGSKGND
jgi:hypothetical protein